MLQEIGSFFLLGLGGLFVILVLIWRTGYFGKKLGDKTDLDTAKSQIKKRLGEIEVRKASVEAAEMEASEEPK